MLLLLTGQMNLSAAQCPHNTADSFPYRIGAERGVGFQPLENGGYALRGRNAFGLTLFPKVGNEWDMSAVSVLGVELKNTGATELVIDTMLCNDGATDWSNSAQGRTIIRPGESIPLGIALRRDADYAGTDPAYLRMSGKPDGTFRHWHTIDPKKVKRLKIWSASTGEHSFELGSMHAIQQMDESKMGVFPILDEYGQYTLKDWPGKVRSDEDLKAGIAVEEKLMAELGKPTGLSKYGGWKDGPKLKATGFFRTQKYNGRWWFVDPEGCLFWSAGANCIGVEFSGQTPTERNPAVFEKLPAKDDPIFGHFHTLIDVEDNYQLLEKVPHYDFTRANLFRKYGKGWEEKQINRDIARMKYCGLNTIGAWSDNAITEKKQVPYTVMLHYEYAFAAEKLPDPFNPETRAGLRKAIEEYPVDFKNDPWCLGAFVNNELHWDNSAKHMVAGILSYAEEGTEVKKVFFQWLEKKYKTVEAFNAAWKTDFQTLENLLGVNDNALFNNADPKDCDALAFLMADAFFGMVKEELRRYSPNVLFLGGRMNSGSPPVIRGAAKHVDVISANIYSYKPNTGHFGNAGKPVLISEFHFANVSGNNLGCGLRSAQDAVQQGRLYKAFVTEAVSHPQIIGAHWFQWRDQNAAGRYDGENYDVGFFDIADMPNEDLIRAAAAAGRDLYQSVP